MKRKGKRMCAAANDYIIVRCAAVAIIGSGSFLELHVLFSNVYIIPAYISIIHDDMAD